MTDDVEAQSGPAAKPGASESDGAGPEASPSPMAPGEPVGAGDATPDVTPDVASDVASARGEGAPSAEGNPKKRRRRSKKPRPRADAGSGDGEAGSSHGQSTDDSDVVESASQDVRPAAGRSKPSPKKGGDDDADDIDRILAEADGEASPVAKPASGGSAKSGTASPAGPASVVAPEAAVLGDEASEDPDDAPARSAGGLKALLGRRAKEAPEPEATASAPSLRDLAREAQQGGGGEAKRDGLGSRDKKIVMGVAGVGTCALLLGILLKEPPQARGVTRAPVESGPATDDVVLGGDDADPVLESLLRRDDLERELTGEVEEVVQPERQPTMGEALPVDYRQRLAAPMTLTLVPDPTKSDGPGPQASAPVTRPSRDRARTPVRTVGRLRPQTVGEIDAELARIAIERAAAERELAEMQRRRRERESGQ